MEIDSLVPRSMGGQTAGEAEAEADTGLRGRKTEPQGWEEPGPKQKSSEAHPGKKKGG